MYIYRKWSTCAWGWSWMKLACHYFITNIKVNCGAFQGEDVERGRYPQVCRETIEEPPLPAARTGKMAKHCVDQCFHQKILKEILRSRSTFPPSSHIHSPLPSTHIPPAPSVKIWTVWLNSWYWTIIKLSTIVIWLLLHSHLSVGVSGSDACGLRYNHQCPQKQLSSQQLCSINNCGWPNGLHQAD